MKPVYALLFTALLSGRAAAADITVSAAASLKDAFGEIARNYQKQYPQSKIRLNTAGSGVLLQQAVQGAPVDVLAFADEETMNQAQAKNVADKAGRKTFALNSLVIAAPKNSKLAVNSLKDLENARFGRIAVSNPAGVPVGRYTKAALEKAGVWAGIQAKVITTQNVRQSLDYVARGEVDAGFVYNTDAVLMKDKVKVLKTVPTQKPVSYPIAVAASSSQKAEAQRFVNYVLSAQGQGVLNKYGFNKP
ncbi:molybdate ABC transporter substrate-binding protein [Neisseria chenwenguii]|uniref:Molybdate ABC transporter substrate-binding protein n=1 Tax=Neisseria chenwenguii TaxID=1853278 RepID=A0A220RZD2_9NEIS|nr:molybdate ABC transporter substrate-binding protein [Neisseria chenwenguii]ASK26547.1 molybdate ABC transporter substrate-binding protein [Neisseria chenwenguii]ROV55989.1 molybdate ABC transporter substrate-binding protein [Neisseria chenwenguii]